jgi:hypothetical protein
MGLELDLRGLPEVEKMLAQFEGQPLQNRTRKALRAGVAVMRKELRARASSGRFPKKFRKTRTRGHRNPVGVSVSPGSPLSTIFEHGARPHAIPITRGPFAGRTIQHPGMAARPLSGPAFDSKRGEAERAIADALFEGV